MSVPVVPIYQSPSKALLIVNPAVHNMYKKDEQGCKHKVTKGW